MLHLWLGCPITSSPCVVLTLTDGARSVFFSFHLFFLSSLLQMSRCTTVVFFPLGPSVPPCSLLALFCGRRGWAAWEAPDWLQAVPLPGLTSRHCFCPLNRINKSMCQVDCSQETMTHFWHHCPSIPPSFPPFLPPSPSASLQLLIRKTLLSWRYALPWGCLAALFSFFLQGIGGGSNGKKCKVKPIGAPLLSLSLTLTHTHTAYMCCGVLFQTHMSSDEWMNDPQMLHPGVF